jgi:hypothetical protein
MAVVIAVAVGLGIVRTPPVIALLAPATIGVLALVLLTRNLSRGEDASAQRRLLTWTLTAFGVHVLLGLAIHGVGARLLAETDASYYHDAAGPVAFRSRFCPVARKGSSTCCRSCTGCSARAPSPG